MSVRRKHIRQLALQILEEQQIDQPAIPVEEIAEYLGATVQEAEADDELSGFIYVDHQNNETVIGVNKQHGETRRRFTIAHELGHMLLHDFDDLHVDRGFSVKLRNSMSSEGTDIEEKEANLFAAELLMPAELIEAELENLDIDLGDEKAVKQLAELYNVSVQAMSFRLMYLGYIDQ